MTITSLLGKDLRKRQARWSALTDKRIKLLVNPFLRSHTTDANLVVAMNDQSSIIGQLLPIKMSAYEPLLEEQVTARRRDEMGGARSF